MQPSTGSRRFNPPWWDHQRQPLRALRRCVEEVFQQKVGNGSGQRVLDLGCGDRPYESLIRSMDFDYIACDLDGDVPVTITPGLPINQPDGLAAGIVSFQVLEHVWDLDWYLGECRRLLKPEGWLLLSTHGAWLYHPHPTDFRRWTRDGLTRELQSRGLIVDAMIGLLGPLAWTTQMRALGLRHALTGIPGLNLLVRPLMVLMNVRMFVEDLVTPRQIREDNACIYVAFCRRSPDHNRD